MEAHANGHTYLHPRDRCTASAQILTSLTVEEVNTVARELCEHLSHMDVSQGVVPAAVVACAPLLDRTGNALVIALHCPFNMLLQRADMSQFVSVGHVCKLFILHLCFNTLFLIF